MALKICAVLFRSVNSTEVPHSVLGRMLELIKKYALGEVKKKSGKSRDIIETDLSSHREIYLKSVSLLSFGVFLLNLTGFLKMKSDKSETVTVYTDQLVTFYIAINLEP